MNAAADALPKKAGDYLRYLFDGTTAKTFGWYHKTIGTQFHKAKLDPEHDGRVFNLARQFIDDVSRFGTAAADLAPRPRPDGYAKRDFHVEIDVNPSDAVERDVRFLQEHIEATGRAARIPTGSPAIQAAKVPNAARGLVAVVKRLFNVDVRFVRAIGIPADLAFDGIYIGRNTVYVNSA